MKGENNCFRVVLILLAIYLVLTMLFPRFPPKMMELYGGEHITVYGNMTCPWTRKQVDYFDNKNIKYTLVECDKAGGRCEELNITGFPTLQMPTGEMKSGYTEL